MEYGKKCDIKDIKKEVLAFVDEDNTIDNVVYDLYGTLIDIHTDEENKNFWKKFAKYLRKHGITYEYKMLRKEYVRLCRKYKEILEKELPGKKVEIELLDVFYELCTIKNRNFTREDTIKAAEYFRETSRAYLRVYEGVFEMFDELKKRGKKVWLLSNAQTVFTVPEIKSTGLYDCFDGITISSEAKVKKPDASFAQFLFDKYPESFTDPSRCLMVGNEYGADGMVAKNSGMKYLYTVSNLTPAE